MKIGKLLGADIRVNLLTVPMGILLFLLGEPGELAIMSASLLLHEAAHALAALACRVEVAEIELMPLGGAARIRGLWSLRSGQILFIALAGPFVNLLLCAAALLVKSEILWRCNLTLMLFNLLPALPLDGGRALAGLLGARLSPAKAARVGVWSGRALAACLALLAVNSAFAGRFNITFAAAAVYIFACGKRELLLAESAGVRSLALRASELARERTMPIEWVAVCPDATVREVASRLTPRRAHLFVLYDEKMRPAGIAGEAELLGASMREADEPFRALCRDLRRVP